MKSNWKWVNNSRNTNNPPFLALVTSAQSCCHLLRLILLRIYTAAFTQSQASWQRLGAWVCVTLWTLWRAADSRTAGPEASPGEQLQPLLGAQSSTNHIIRLLHKGSTSWRGPPCANSQELWDKKPAAGVICFSLWPSLLLQVSPSCDNLWMQPAAALSRKCCSLLSHTKNLLPLAKPRRTLPVSTCISGLFFFFFFKY